MIFKYESPLDLHHLAVMIEGYRLHPKSQARFDAIISLLSSEDEETINVGVSLIEPMFKGLESYQHAFLRIFKSNRYQRYRVQSYLVGENFLFGRFFRTLLPKPYGEEAFNQVSAKKMFRQYRAVYMRIQKIDKQFQK